LASEAQATFEVLVDDYIETCRAVGKAPAKPFRGTFNVRIGPELHRQAALAAADAGETLNAWVIGAAQERLRRAHGRGGAGGKDRA
jgi:predicted HicB family RNase H-like nuclease